MSLAPKFGVFGQTVPSRRRVVSSIKLPDVPLGRPDAAKRASAEGIAASGRTPQPELPPVPEEGMGLKGAPRIQRKQANRGERMGRLSYSFREDFGNKDAKRKEQATRSHQTNRETAKLTPQSESIPLWLTWLIQWQRRSSVVTFLLVSATLAVYGGTVYTQQLWNREYRQLETLQLQQRQLTAASEVLKHQLAQQAEQQNTGLIPATPNTNLFLQPAQQQPLPSPSSTPATAPGSNPQLLPKPVGY
jgi:hypothetical protein